MKIYLYPKNAKDYLSEKKYICKSISLNKRLIQEIYLKNRRLLFVNKDKFKEEKNQPLSSVIATF